MERLGLGVGKMQAAWGRAQQANGGGGNTAEAPQAPLPMLPYAEERARRVLYQDAQLHLLVRTPARASAAPAFRAQLLCSPQSQTNRQSASLPSS